MFYSKIRSGEAEIIESKSVLTFIPDFVGQKLRKIKEPDTKPRPIEIDLYYSKEFLFRLNFSFENDDSGASWSSRPDKPAKTQYFVIKNPNKSENPVNSFTSFEVATAGDGSKFYVSFTSTAVDPNFIRLDYTIYRVKGEDNIEDRPE